MGQEKGQAFWPVELVSDLDRNRISKCEALAAVYKRRRLLTVFKCLSGQATSWSQLAHKAREMYVKNRTPKYAKRIMMKSYLISGAARPGSDHKAPLLFVSQELPSQEAL